MDSFWTQSKALVGTLVGQKMKLTGVEPVSPFTLALAMCEVAMCAGVDPEFRSKLKNTIALWRQWKLDSDIFAASCPISIHIASTGAWLIIGC